MSMYLRPSPMSGFVFFTVCLARSGSGLLVRDVALLRQAVRATRERRPFDILAWVVLPDHMHAIWRMPAEDPNYSERWGAIKARFSRDVRVKYGPGAVGWNPTLQNHRQGRVGLDPTIAVGQGELALLQENRSPSKRAKQDAGIWQRRFWEHHIRGPADLRKHLHYCWTDPVRHGLTSDPLDWPYSSIHRDYHDGRYDPKAVTVIPPGRFGEAA